MICLGENLKWYVKYKIERIKKSVHNSVFSPKMIVLIFFLCLVWFSQKGNMLFSIVSIVGVFVGILLEDYRIMKESGYIRNYKLDYYRKKGAENTS